MTDKINTMPETATDAKAKLLFVTDHDHTLHDKAYADLLVLDHDVGQAGLKELFAGRLHWGEFMDEQLGLLHEKGVRYPEIANMLRGSPCHAVMLDAIARLRTRYDATIVSLSSGNEQFVSEMLAQAGHSFDHVIAQKAWFEPDGRLRIRHCNGLDDPHQCPDGCYTGMCKGDELEKIVNLADFDRRIYVGDGGNDLCGALRLSEGDVILPRKDWPLDKALATRKVKATVRAWATPEEAASIIDSI